MSAEELERLIVDLLGNPQLLADLLEDADLDLAPLAEIDEAVTFEDRGVMCLNRGAVIRTEDGGEFQLEIVRSR